MDFYFWRDYDLSECHCNGHLFPRELLACPVVETTDHRIGLSLGLWLPSLRQTSSNSVRCLVLEALKMKL